MSVLEFTVCPGSLKEGFKTYSPSVLRHLFDGRTVNHILPYTPFDREDQEMFLENRKRISISGMQEKLSLIQVKNKLRLTEENEQGTHILKPIPRDLIRAKQVPANEHLTMQIAEQVYDITVAPNALIFFKDGVPAYITKRFDVLENGDKRHFEDFATLAGKTSEGAGQNYKYDSSYLEIGQIIKQYVPAWPVEIEKYFSLVVFNFLFSNGDAHLKNFAVLETQDGDFVLSPAYDLINTRVHVRDTYFALKGGLIPEEMRSGKYRKQGVPKLTDFVTLGRELGMQANRIDSILHPYVTLQESVKKLTENSFLDEKTKRAYLQHYRERRNILEG